MKTEGFRNQDTELWKKVDQLVNEQKLEAASAEVTRIRELALKKKDDVEYTRALIKEVQLRLGLHGYETSVRFLRETPWPELPLGRVVLDLYYGFNLLAYLDSYSWEINRREKVATTKVVDLKAWTKDQIFAEALRAYDEVWAQRDALGTEPPALLEEYVNLGSYPANIRGTLRDTVGYLTIGLLQNTARWRPEETNDLFQLDLAALIKGGKLKVGKLDDPSAHPMVKISAILDDLEAWHTAAGRKEAALEARLERYRRLAAAFTEESDRKRIKDALVETLKAARALPWWAEGQALYAEFVRDHESDLVQAHAIAEEGAAAYPNTSGGQKCTSIAKSIEQPAFQLQALNNDALGKRSVHVSHKNLGTLYFRAYEFDLIDRIESAQDYNLLPDYRDIEKLVQKKPSLAWEAPLPKTPDYKMHTTYVTPPLKKKGAYIITASARANYAYDENRIGALIFIVSDLVITERTFRGERIEVTVLDGPSGKAVPSARVGLYTYDYKRKHHEVESSKTSGDGMAVFKPKQGQSYFLLAKKDDDVSLDQTSMYLYAYGKPAAVAASLIFTDRSVYRPEQTLHFKVLAYDGNAERTKFNVTPKQWMNVWLYDGNNQLVDTKEVTTNEFGSASGTFKIPTGRLLGGWSIRTSNNGHANVRVEEYKRPTFEVSFKQAEGALRLNKAAAFTGEAKYYFGLPVTNGAIKWRITRQAQYPWWWWYWYWSTPNTSAQQVAAGTAKLDDKGQFKIEFTPAADERQDKAITYYYAVHADLTDEGGETRSADRSFRLGFVTVEASLTLPHNFVLAEDDAAITFNRTNLDGAPKAGDASFKLFALKQPSETALPADLPMASKKGAGYVTPGDALRPRHQPNYAPEQVLTSWDDGQELKSGALKHDTNGRAEASFGRLPPGAYRVRYTTKDDFGASYETFRNFIVAGKRTPLNLPGLLMVYDGNVKVGGKAYVLVHSGLRDQTMIYERYRGEQRLERRLLDSDEATLIEIPVSESDRGGFGVSMYAVRDHQSMAFQGGVMVPWDDKELELSFQTFRDTLRPGTKETWRIAVKAKTSQKAEAKTAEILAYMYDRSLDVFAPHYAPSPHALYATYWGAALPRINLQALHEAASLGHGWGVPGYPSFYGESLRFYHSYGIGGLGNRYGGGGRHYKNGHGGPSMPSPAAAPMEEREADDGVMARKDAPSPSRRMASSDMRAEATLAQPKAPGATTPDAPAKGPEVRSNFAETAFFLPQLVSGDDGTAAIEFTVPDSVTAYNVWVHAVTKDFRSGSLRKDARAVKELMVRPYMPRFLREGDKADLKVVVNNAGEKELSGEVSFEIFDPETQKSLADEFQLKTLKQPFKIKAGGGNNVAFSFTAPKRIGVVAFRVIARAGEWSDGELRPLPVLPSRMHLAQSRFVTLRDKQKRTMVFDDLLKNDDPSLVNEKLVVTIDAQLFYTVLKALPYLLEYPYECAEQTLNRFVSAGILSSLYKQFPSVAEMAKDFSKRQSRLETFDAPDPNRRMTLEESPWVEEAKGGEDIPSAALINVLDPAVAQRNRETALAKLKKMQTSNGAFPWFPGGPPSPYITLYLLYGFAKAVEFQVDVPKDMVQRAWQYVASHIKNDVFTCMRVHDGCWEFVTFVNYVLTAYPDKTWGQEAFDDKERKEMLDFSFKHWKQHAPMLKAYLALTLKRMGREKDGRLVFESVMDSAKTKQDEGTFWAAEDRSWLWYNDTIETHALALRTLTELMPEHDKRDGLVLWILLNKKLNHWKSTRATAEVIYSLAHYMKADKSLGVREEAKVSIGDLVQNFVFEPTKYVGKTQIVLKPEEVTPARATINVEKETKGFMFASATWHFSTERLPKEDRGDFFKVSRTYFKRENDGKQMVLKPLADGAVLEPGDELEVQLSLRSKHEAEYVHLRDPRGAGFEPEKAVSRYKWDLGISWYEEYRDSGTNFFFEKLPVGEYTFKYRIRVAMGGTFRVGPAVVQSMYAPEFVAYSAGHVLNVKASEK
ncbi:MAG: hypothetical protein IT381_24875 [Deltaproteobacteria bacterium]|nr:hypothetical protein [Deltaproteobacteria bacterium]